MQSEGLEHHKAEFLKAADALSIPEREKQLEEMAKACIEARERHEFGPLPEPDATGRSYRRFRGVPVDGDPVEFLKQHEIWGPRLKINNGWRDFIFQDQLHRLDGKLLAALHSGYSKGWKEGALAEILPTRSHRLEQEIDALKRMGIRTDDLGRLGQMIRIREIRRSLGDSISR